jgi:hypothetical protein
VIIIADTGFRVVHFYKMVFGELQSLPVLLRHSSRLQNAADFLLRKSYLTETQYPATLMIAISLWAGSNNSREWKPGARSG